MQRTAIDRFRAELKAWVFAHNREKAFTTDPEATFAALEARLGVEPLAQIGAGFINGWLTTEEEVTRGYFVRESDRPGKRGGRFVLINRGAGKADPCWELFVQLADYARLRAIAERHGQSIRLEDRLMDLTVSTQNKLLLYVEHKQSKAEAQHLINAMRRYGNNGFNLDDADRGNDPLRKAKYLVRDPEDRPVYFAVSAVGFRRLFRVQYQHENRFELIDDERSLSAPLIDNPAKGGTAVAEWNSVDALAIEISHLCPSVWISVGSGKTAYNFYASGADADAIVIGMDEANAVWTDVAGLGPERATRLSCALSKLKIILDVKKKWTFWRYHDARFRLAPSDAPAVAEAVRDSLQIQ